MRCRLNKNIDLSILLGQLPLLKKYGWRKLKLYLMIGFPWEKEEDIAAIKEMLIPFEKERIDINLSVSPFIPKPHTPFQWLPMEDGTILSDKISMLKKILKGRRVKVKYRDPKTSVIEAIVTRGDSRLSPLFEYLFQKGVKLEAWREYFQPGLYDEWFEQQGISMKDYLGKKPIESGLPWDIVNTGIDKSFLASELIHAQSGEKTEDCYSGCAACGIGCSESRYALRVTSYELKSEPQPTTEVATPETDTLTQRTQNPQLSTGVKYTFRYGKYGDARYIGHLDTMNILLRALRSLGITIRTHGKFHPIPKYPSQMRYRLA